MQNPADRWTVTISGPEQRRGRRRMPASGGERKQLFGFACLRLGLVEGSDERHNVVELLLRSDDDESVRTAVNRHAHGIASTRALLNEEIPDRTANVIGVSVLDGDDLHLLLD